MGWESSGVVGFDLGPLLEGQMRTAKLKVLITCLLLVLEVLVHCLCGGYNLHRFSDVLGLVIFVMTFLFPRLSTIAQIVNSNHEGYKENQIYICSMLFAIECYTSKIKSSTFGVIIPGNLHICTSPVSITV